MQKRSKSDAAAPALEIKSGSYHGEQFVDNTEEIVVSEHGIVYSVRSDHEDPSRPDIEAHLDLDPGAWEEIERALDLETIEELPAVVGQPDHADQGAEWLQIRRGDFEKAVRFEAGKQPPELSEVVENLRKLRKRAATTKGRPLP